MHRTALLGGLLLAMVGSACADGNEATGGAGASSSSTTGQGTGGDGGAGGGAGGGEGGQGGTIACDDSMTPADSSCVLTNDLGVFVQEGGDDAADGTREAPVKTLARAIELAQEKGKRVYACAQTFSEQLTIGSGVEIYGGLSCKTDWGWVDGNPTQVLAAADVIPVVRLLGGQGKTVLSDLRIVAPNATVPGSSAIAVIADGAEADLVRCQIEAGDAAAGAAGPPHAGPAAAGPDGDDGKNTDCIYAPVSGAPANPNPACPESVGGAGGYSAQRGSPAGGPGGDGLPIFGGMNGGEGQPGNALLTGPYCTNGTAGLPGDQITVADPGGGGVGKGELSSAGYSGVAGKNGGQGKAGQGGGGGGGGKGCQESDGSYSGDDSGGAGGAGGCGGLGGIGGGAGGSSIALVMWNATVKLDQTTLIAGNGGNGGQGGPPQQGGVGGLGGLGGLDNLDGFYGCKGGPGGPGGNGGNAGGGAGGHSVSVAYVGSPPVDVGSALLHGARGMGGTDSSGGLAGAGSDGIAAESEEF